MQMSFSLQGNRKAHRSTSSELNRFRLSLQTYRIIKILKLNTSLIILNNLTQQALVQFES